MPKLFVSEVAKAEHQSKERVLHRGRWFLASRRALRELRDVGISSDTTLKHWAEKGCPWLGGKLLTMKELEGGYNRRIRYYAEDEIKAIAKAKAAGDQPKYPGLTYIGDACADLSVSEKTLRRKAAAHKPPVELERKPSRSTDGRGLPRTFVPIWFVDEWKRERFPNLPDDEITVGDAATILECSTPQIHALIKEGALTPANRKRKLPRVYEQQRGDKKTTQRGVRRAFTLSRAQVTKVKTDGIWPPPIAEPEPFTDAEGTWIPRKLIPKEYPHIPNWFPTKWANKSMPFAGGVVLTAKPIKWPKRFIRFGPVEPLGFLKAALDAVPNPLPKRAYARPSQERHLIWKRWRDEGLTITQIQRRWEQEKGERLTWRAFKVAIENVREPEAPPPQNGHVEPATTIPEPPRPTSTDLVTLDQIAATVHRNKRSLERYVNQMPQPQVKGKKGKPSLWSWSEVRPWLASAFDIIPPDEHPALK